MRRLIVLLLIAGCQNRDIQQNELYIQQCKSDTCVSSGIKGKFFTVMQPTPYTCWASVLCMMFSWKNRVFTSEKEILKAYPAYLRLFEEGETKGITIEQEKALYPLLGLSIEQQLNPTIKGWCEMIDKYGPLSITIDARPPYGTIHAILILAIYGAETGLNTRVVYADPATGKILDENFLAFLKMYESKYSVDWPIQIIHFTEL